MGRIVVLGDAAAVDGFALGGATVISAADPEAVRRAWETLPADAAVVVLTASASAVLGAPARARRPDLLTISMPP
jgi:vacuolar-type H+-ATPase subunit F/Vma7